MAQLLLDTPEQIGVGHRFARLPGVLSTMLRLKPKQRVALGETFRELANLLAGPLALGQFVGQALPSWRLLLAGVAMWILLVSIGLVLIGDTR